jgi:acetolactate synthase-1/2/3 large subunit
VAPTWGARDMLPEDDPDVLCVGGFGTHGTRAANFAVQNADWILSVGSRLDSKATGTPRSYFARGARIFMVDIDPAEIAKFHNELGREFTGVQADAKMFLAGAVSLAGSEDGWPDFAAWRERCRAWMARYPVCRPEYEAEEGVNPYVLVRQLAEHCRPGEVIVSDTGLALAWMMQGFAFKEGQRFVHAFNQTPMGYGLPAAIGAAFARPGQRVVLVNGDGSFMLNIQELSLLAYHKLPIKIILVNNDGHAMCRQTQEQWLGGKYYSTSTESGLAMPDFCEVAAAHCIRATWVKDSCDVDSLLEWLLVGDDPALLEVRIDGAQRLIPQVQMGRPNEDGNPPLPREELAEQMIVGVVER